MLSSCGARSSGIQTTLADCLITVQFTARSLQLAARRFVRARAFLRRKAEEIFFSHNNVSLIQKHLAHQRQPGMLLL
jgi:hypothetical protein